MPDTMSQSIEGQNHVPESRQKPLKESVFSGLDKFRKTRNPNTGTRPDNTADQLSYARQEIGQFATAGGPDFSSPSPQDNVLQMATSERTAAHGGASAGTFRDPRLKQPSILDDLREAAKKTARWALKTKAGRWALALTIGGGAVEATGTTYVELTDNQPASAVKVVKEMGTWPVILGQRILSGEKTPTIFDGSKDKGSFGTQNIITLTPNAMKEKFPEQAITTNKSIQFLLPFDLPPGTTVNYERNLTGQLGNDAVKTEAEKNGVKDNMVFTLPKDTTIFTPVDAHVMLSKGIPNDPLDNPSMTGLIRVFYYDEKQDTTYALVFFDTTDPAKRNFFQPLIPMTESAPDIWRGTNWENLPTIQQGGSLVKTTIDKQRINLNIRAYKGKKVGPEAELIDKTFFLVTPNLLTTPDANGNSQIVGRQK